jgi:hypothetical protein
MFSPLVDAHTSLYIFETPEGGREGGREGERVCERDNDIYGESETE